MFLLRTGGTRKKSRTPWLARVPGKAFNVARAIQHQIITCHALSVFRALLALNLPIHKYCVLLPRSQEFVSKYEGAAEAAVAAGGTTAPAKRKAPEAKKGRASSSSTSRGGKKAKGRGGK